MRNRFRPILAVLVLPGILLATAAAALSYAEPSATDGAGRRLELFERAVRRADVQDAKRQVFRSRFWARADVRSLVALDQALATDDPVEAHRLASDFLRQAAEDGEASFELELARMPGESLYALARNVGCAASPIRDCVLERYRADAAILLAADLERLSTLARSGDHGAVGLWLDELRESLRPSIKSRGRALRKALTFPAYPAVYAWRRVHSAHEYEGPQPIDFADYRLYEPDRTPTGDPELDLLTRYAPVLVQEIDPGADYPAQDDRIGALRLGASEKGIPRPEVDTTLAVSYAYTQTLPLGDRELTQLVYTFWYPEHPKLKSVDAGAGPIEGITLRLTLDESRRPRLFETIYNCGCSHRLFVDSELERQAAAEYGPPEGDRPYSIQRDLDGRIDLVVPELVDFVPGEPLHFFVRAGFHMPAAVRFGLPPTVSEGTARRYAVRPYRELERMPFEGGWASIFDENGLVRGAKRPLEEALLTPLGIYRAGHPRQRGTQLIHFDQADFDDPELFERYLRLPSSLDGSAARRARGSLSTR